MEQTNNDIYTTSSYAKINLGLHVLKKLPNGYHEIETGFCFIDWADTLDVIPHRLKDTMKCNDESIPVDDSNLVMKAVNHFRKYVAVKENFNITLNKKIPAGAGLGGGSSNAASMMRTINKISGVGLSDEEMAQLSSGLGADVPLFLKGKTGIASGIGTDIEYINIQPDLWILTVFPGVFSSTPEAYELCIPREEREFNLKKILTEEEPDEWRFVLENDLELPVIYKHKLVGDMKDHLYELGALYSSMSGSGSAVFGLFEQEFVAVDAYKSLIDLNFNVNLTPPLFSPDWRIYRKS